MVEISPHMMVGKVLVLRSESVSYAFLISHVRSWSGGEIRFYFSPVTEFENGVENFETRLIYAEARDGEAWVIYAMKYDAGDPVGDPFEWSTFEVENGMIV